MDSPHHDVFSHGEYNLCLPITSRSEKLNSGGSSCSRSLSISESESSTCLSTHSQTSSRTYLRHTSRIHGLDATHCAPNIIWVIWPIAVSICLSTLSWILSWIPFGHTTDDIIWFLSKERPGSLIHSWRSLHLWGNFGVRCHVVSHLAWMVE